MIEAITAGGAYFIFVFFKAFQQRNVMGLHYKWILPISYLMSAAELFVIAMVARQAVQGWAYVLPMIAGVGTGGGTGAILSMWLHHKYIGVDKCL